MNEQVMQFEKAMDAAMKSKFIMIDKRVSDILKSIAASYQIYDVVKDSLLGFDFGREISMATSIEGHFAVPYDNKRVIALGFCLFSAIDDKKIDVNQLLANNFTGEDPYARFCDEFLVRFKSAVMESLGEEKMVEKPKNKQMDPALVSRAEYLLGQLKEYEKSIGQKYIDCLIKSLKMEDIMFIEVFFDLVQKYCKRNGKILLNEIRQVIEVLILQ